MTRFACATIDLDPLRCYFDNRGWQPGPQTRLNAVYDDGLPRFLDILEQLRIPATFFAVGRDALEPGNAAQLQAAVARGHEIANHSFSHPTNFARLDREGLAQELLRGQQALNEATGVAVCGFRAPGWNVQPALFELLSEHGYRYDSSLVPLPASRFWSVLPRLSPQAFGGRLLTGQGRWPKPPAHPYRLDHRRPWRELRTSQLWEVPNGLTGGWLPLPLSATALAMLGPRAERLVAQRASRHAEPLVLVFHGVDLVDFDTYVCDDRLRGKPGLTASIAAKQRRVKRLLRTLGKGRCWSRVDQLVTSWEGSPPEGL